MSTRRLKDRVAIVTGAAQGIGRGIALQLAKEGAKVVIADIEIDQANKVADEIKALGGEAIATKTDVTQYKEAEQMAKTTLAEFGQIDILVNNAGGSARERGTLFCDSSEEIWRFVIDRNLFGTLNCCHVVIRHMMERRSGKIANMSSEAAAGISTGHAEYGVAKAGIVVFTRILAREVADYGINVNVIAPGAIDTRGLRSTVLISMGKDRQTAFEHFKSEVRGLRRIGEPEDVGYLLAFLVSDEASLISGQYYEMGCLR